MQMNEARKFFSEYNLRDARNSTLKKPAAHQAMAIDHLIKWYNSNHSTHSSGILVLPTGGGKTFTAIRFVCRTALSDGYKVLWLAHTHHLLEQAYYSFGEHVAAISEPRYDLKLRVVSGTIGHFRISDIQSDDDVVIATLQTVTKAYSENHFALNSFIDSAKGKLFVVFDEAHHAPAPSYRKLITDLRDRCKDMHLLGLTATPVYSDENLQGWLSKLFPQGILYQVTPQSLMAQGILAKPIREQQKTNFTPNFDLREYQKWVGTFRDIPEDIITQLAENKDRNNFIAEQYSRGKGRYGKTLIFADRWYQCEAIAEQLRKRGVRTGTVYSHVDAGMRSSDARNKRKSDENARILDSFRRNELDVLVNVRMLTEGTDIPDVNTCFITRQTTSKILMTQMVGRALRGPKFGGTPEAYLVFFTDEWEQLINWAEYDMIDGGFGPDPAYGKKPPVRYISIELVRKLAAQMDSGININIEPFLTLLPVGWYRVEYAAKQSDSEEIERVQRLVMVFENEAKGYERLINELQSSSNSKFFDEGIQLEEVSSEIAVLQSEYFSNEQEHYGSDLSQDIFSIVRHIAQTNSAPRFFDFEERKRHDLDLIAEDLMVKDLSRIQEDNALQLEFNRQDRYWQVLYITYELFKSQYNACVERILHAGRHGANPENHIIKVKMSSPSDYEPSEELKQQVKERDGECMCCGTRNSRYLEVDHIVPKYFGGNNILDNLQTLCRKCNQLKGTERINFLDCQTDLTQPSEILPNFETPEGMDAGSPESWAEFLSRTINFFYKCNAVHSITIGKRGDSFYNWRIELHAGNNPKWLELHLGMLMNRIIGAKKTGGYALPKSITIGTPDLPEIRFERK
ncbi:MAG: type I restriction enzyme EcoKI subunit R [Methanosaeta sp. PtaU1.Bin112]|nr:MAG: type I restriction enzyme EcoKI subunit R [Methanosaeta sp. PtaU1.Bin112]